MDETLTQVTANKEVAADSNLLSAAADGAAEVAGQAVFDLVFTAILEAL